MDNLQDMPETVAVYLAGIQRLRAFEQHVELLVGFMQMPRLFRNRGFERTVERSQLGRHMVEGAGKAQLVRQGGIRRRGVKFARSMRSLAATRLFSGSTTWRRMRRRVNSVSSRIPRAPASESRVTV
jgi:hypothetical protein